ncbi:MAG: branched-chain amino acid ABC transporter permease, partial [Comamonadaceae bacterium]
LAFSEIAFFLVSASKPLGRSDGLMLPRREDGWLNLSFAEKWPYGLCAIALLAFTMLVSTWLLRNRAGSYWRAIRDNEEAANALGVPVFRYKLLVFVLSAALTAAGGALYAGYIGFVDPRSVLGPEVSVQALVFAIVGGLSVVWGPLLGAAILLPLGELLRIWIGGSINGLAIMTYAVVLITLSLTMPQGIGGWLATRWSGRGRAGKTASTGAAQPAEVTP